MTMADITATPEKLERLSKTGISPKKLGKLGGRIQWDHPTIDSILDDAETLEDLCFLKNILKVDLEKVKKIGLYNEAIEIYENGINKVNEKIKKNHQIS